MRVPSPFYADWQFWAFVVAAIAVLLSQLPPLYFLARKGRLSCEAVDQIYLSHTIGNPSGQWHVLLENTGGRPLRVDAITLTFTRLGGDSFVVPVRSYLQAPNSTDSIMFTPFRLRAGETWAHVINFFVPRTRDEEQHFRALQSRIRTDIVEQKTPENEKKWVETTDHEAVAGLVELMKSRFKWQHGEYSLALDFKVSRADHLAQPYSLILFESDSKQLAAHAERYKYGDGVWFFSEATGLLVPVRKQ